MGKNKDLLVICLAPDGKPSRVEIMEGDSAANLFRVEHGSAGSSFPGFNVPTPLRCLSEAPTERLMPAVEHLLTLNKNKNAMITDFAAAIAELFSLSTPRGFTDSQEKQFQRCCFELVSELRETLGKSPAELKNFLPQGIPRQTAMYCYCSKTFCSALWDGRSVSLRSALQSIGRTKPNRIRTPTNLSIWIWSSRTHITSASHIAKPATESTTLF